MDYDQGDRDDCQGGEDGGDGGPRDESFLERMTDIASVWFETEKERKKSSR